MTALEKAIKLLAARARTEHELDAALIRAGYSETDRHAALARLRELRYLDDRETARQRARSRVGLGDAPRLAARKLEAQGVGKAMAREAAAEAAEGLDEGQLLKRALQRKLRGRKPPRTDREKQRLLRSLIAKGHRPGAAAKALGVEWDGDDELEE
ncbi:MAG TPA: RecX family transcriptional regulator [Myxococcales bacterium]|nr:RecX family transcriptional regulator [Myxococcales bacterium]